MTAAQREALHDALLDAFRTAGDFNRVVSFGLDTSLDQIAGGGTLVDQVLATIMWADAHDRLDDLIAAARRDNPDNQRLRLFESAWKDRALAGTVTETVPPPVRTRGTMRPSLVSTSEDLMRLMNFGASWMCSALTTLVVVYLAAVDRAPWWSVIVTVLLVLPVTVLINRGPRRVVGT